MDPGTAMLAHMSQHGTPGLSTKSCAVRVLPFSWLLPASLGMETHGSSLQQPNTSTEATLLLLGELNLSRTPTSLSVHI